jgi:hypothetical protein
MSASSRSTMRIRPIGSIDRMNRIRVRSMSNEDCSVPIPKPNR